MYSVDPATYYIRSSVLGGETLTEVNSTGRKVKTHVLAAGAKIAEQKQYYGTTTTQQVFFENWDAAGISRRTMTATGTAFLWDGGEEFPVEADPMGGNVGTTTPYIELLPPWEPPQEFSDLLPILSDSPTYVNGQRVTCTLDGFAIGCSQARSMLENGSALPEHLAEWQGVPGFSFEHRGLGIFTTTFPDWWTNNSGRIWPQAPGTRGEGWVIVEGGTSIYPINWGVTVNVSESEGGAGSDELIRLGNSLSEGQRLIKETGDFVRTILEGDNACARFFGRGATEVLDILLSKLRPGLVPNRGSGLGISMQLPMGTTKYTPNWLRKYIEPSAATVQIGGMFLNHTRSVGNLPSNSLAGRSIQLLHELAHLLFSPRDTRAHLLLFQWDGQSSTRSKFNTETILLACRAAIYDELRRREMEANGIDEPAN